ncbi:SLBB domain-containing protein [Thalassotalea ganghwensis]
MTIKMSNLIRVVTVIWVLITCSVFANNLPSNISAGQIAQFKKLPPAQQKALAQSMGIDYNAIRSYMSKQSTNSAQENEELPQYFPRGTQFDELGNPILNDESQIQISEEDSEEIKAFGYDVFANAPTTFAPSMDIAIPEQYILGPGDVLSVQFFGKENNSFELEVSREGQVIFPELGAYSVVGMSFVEAKAFLSHELKNKILGVDVIVTLSELRSIRVFVLGDAFKPGQYVLNSLSNITHALFSAGGISDIGSLRNIQLKRAGKLITTLDLYDYLIRGDSSNDLTLKSGDVVFVAPVGNRVTVEGEVTRPAIYELNKGETFADVIEMAGGLLPSAYPSSTVVERFNDRNLRTVLNVDLSNSQVLKKPVKAGDYINVMPTSEQFEESVAIIGAVSRPGKYQWVKEQRITDLIPDINAYTLEDADLSYSLVIRQVGFGRQIEVIQFSLFNAISDVNSKDNVQLKPRDKVLVFSNVDTLSNDSLTLENFALTEEKLLKKEKEKAEEKFQQMLFWEMYGDGQVEDNTEQEESALEHAYRSLEELSGEASKTLELKEMGFFSRKRLLAPVIELLKRQAAFGAPMMLVEVDGAVKFPGIYPLANNSHATDLITAAGGLLESAYTVKAEITRNNVVNHVAGTETLGFNVQKALNGNEEHNLILESKDRLNVLSIPSWQENHIVELKGEFNFPGKYTIRRGESLRDLIERVGGFTEYADIGASLFTREKLKQLELKNLIKVSENLRMEIASKSLSNQEGSALDYQQARKLLSDLTKVQPVGRLVVDIDKILTNDDTDITLENGDTLYVPTKQDSINVVGQVQVATSHVYQPDLDVLDYVELSGGMKRQADDERLYVIKANGSVEIPQGANWFSSSKQTLRPGDTIVVPLDSSYMENITLWQVSTQIIYQAAVAIAAISGI